MTRSMPLEFLLRPELLMTVKTLKRLLQWITVRVHVSLEMGRPNIARLAAWVSASERALNARISAAVSYTVCYPSGSVQPPVLTSPVWLNACSLSFEGFRNSLPHPSCSQAKSLSPRSSAPVIDCDLDRFPGVLVWARVRDGELIDRTSSNCTYSSSSSSSSESLCPGIDKADMSLSRGRSLAVLREEPA